MSEKFNSRGEQVGNSNQLKRMGIHAQTQQERMQLDTERMEQQIRMLNPDGTREDRLNVVEGIAQVQSQTRDTMNRVLENSSKVTCEMVKYEEDADAAAERAREDAERMDTLKVTLHYKGDFELKIQHIGNQKRDSAAFQQTQFKDMKTADNKLQEVIESTKRAVHKAISGMK